MKGMVTRASGGIRDMGGRGRNLSISASGSSRSGCIAQSVIVGSQLRAVSRIAFAARVSSRAMVLDTPQRAMQLPGRSLQEEMKQNPAQLLATSGPKLSLMRWPVSLRRWGGSSGMMSASCCWHTFSCRRVWKKRRGPPSRTCFWLSGRPGMRFRRRARPSRV